MSDEFSRSADGFTSRETDFSSAAKMAANFSTWRSIVSAHMAFFKREGFSGVELITVQIEGINVAVESTNSPDDAKMDAVGVERARTMFGSDSPY